MRKNFLFISFSIFLIIQYSLSFAFMEGLSTERLTRESEVVITGKVEDVQSQWSRDRKIIFTRATIKIHAVIKGRAADRSIVVEYKGGEVGSIGMRVSDAVSLKKGERVLMFLKSGVSYKNGKIFNIVGKAQGKYTISDDGIAQKSGFSAADGKGVIDNNIRVDELIKKIKGVR